MKALSAASFALVLAVPLAACGGGNKEDAPVDLAGATESAAAGSAAASDAAGDASSAAASEAPSSAASAAASAAPSMAPSARPSALASATAAAAAAAPAGPPASFAICSACHATTPGKNGIGPSLAGIWGEKAGTVPGYTFSQAMIDSGLTWNQGTLDRYLADPKGVVPGTKMTFAGLKDPAKRKEVIDYIRSLR